MNKVLSIGFALFSGAATAAMAGTNRDDKAIYEALNLDVTMEDISVGNEERFSFTKLVGGLECTRTYSERGRNYSCSFSPAAADAEAIYRAFIVPAKHPVKGDDSLYRKETGGLSCDKIINGTNNASYSCKLTP